MALFCFFDQILGYLAKISLLCLRLITQLMHRHIIAALAFISAINAAQAGGNGLTFDASKGVAGSVTLPRGEVVNYTAYTGLYYVANVEDSTYQYMNIYVPEGATQQSPIFMPNDVGGYMAARPRSVDGNGASGRALSEGFVVAIAGARGRDSTVGSTYTGRAPKGLLDLKAAIRYLRHFDSEIPGDAEHIITDGTSAGGAMSSLLGSTGNNPTYEPLLKAMGAADERDDIFAAVCFCPIIDLDHADMAYEWLYGCTNDGVRRLNDAQKTVSEELAAAYPEYLNSLNLSKSDGTSLTADNYLDYLKEILIASAQEAKDAGADIPDSIGFTFGSSHGLQAPLNGGVGGPSDAGPQGDRQGPPDAGGGPGNGGPGGDRQGPPDSGGPGNGGPGNGGPRGGGPRGMMGMVGGMGSGETITSLDLPTYLAYVVSTTPLKTPPAFDSQGVAGGRASGENEEFGDETGSSVNFTDYSLRKATGDASATVDAAIAENVRLLNPMRMMEDEGSTIAPHWYIRHGARDRDTSFPVPVNLATKLQNKGKDVNFKLPWNRPHSGDYALNELFAWMHAILAE